LILKPSSAPPSDHFIQVVKAYETEFDDVEYNESIDGISKTDLACLNQEDVNLFFYPYFITFGRMARVLGFNGCSRLGVAIREFHNDFNETRKHSLEERENVPNIQELYERLMNYQIDPTSIDSRRIGPTATSKMLHLVAPDFFIMWDADIRNLYGFGATGKEYQRFLVTMKNWIECLNPSVTVLSKEYKKSKTKIIDEFNWYRLRPWWQT
jgi:hypothetical protein